MGFDLKHRSQIRSEGFMRRSKVLAFAAATTITLSFCTSSHAADPVDDMIVTDFVIEEPVYDWSGTYLGGHVGYTHLRGQDRFDSSSGYDGAVGGIFSGYNFVYDNFFVGPELEASYWGYSGHSSSGLDLDSDYMLAAKLRAGITYDFLLGYANIGVATSRITAENRRFGSNSDSAQMTGWMIGAGVEAFITERLAVRLDYQHIDFGSKTFQIGSTSFSEDVTNDMVRLGVSYHFETF